MYIGVSVGDGALNYTIFDRVEKTGYSIKNV
jgi:hypothetical protein